MEILHIGDKAYHLIHTGQLRRIKIGKLRRISRTWIGQFIEQVGGSGLRRVPDLPSFMQYAVVGRYLRRL